MKEGQITQLLLEGGPEAMEFARSWLFLQYIELGAMVITFGGLLGFLLFIMAKDLGVLKK